MILTYSLGYTMLLRFNMFLFRVRKSKESGTHPPFPMISSIFGLMPSAMSTIMENCSLSNNLCFISVVKSIFLAFPLELTTGRNCSIDI